MSKLRFSRAFSGVILTAALVAPALGPVAPASAQTPPPSAENEDAIDAELIGYTVLVEPMTDADWQNPVTQFDLDPSTLVPLPEFDVADFHDSTVFASGVDRVSTEGNNTADGSTTNATALGIHIDRHRRLLQAIATLERDAEFNAEQIAERRPMVDRLLRAIDYEQREEARLANEISIHKEAIAEFAVRAFIDQDDVAEALSVPQTELGETRVVTDEIREDQNNQIAVRLAELARRERRRAGLEIDLGTVRSEIRVLRRERAEILEHLRTASLLPVRTEASYKLALHERLPRMVRGTDIPLVALNAYVVAERRLAEERPECGIEWWMLAGIGKIESFHGHFGNSTLNANGHTTEAIRGPALDGRILEGSEFVTDGNAPAATGRTEEQAVSTPTPEPASVEPAIPAPEPLASTDNPDATPGEPGEPGEDDDVAATAPAPVIKRLALIADSDGGRLDDDTVYDRAVGPMQFIPQTWRRFEADGNADERSDPQNMYDASLASARYLCAASSMRTPEGRKVAFFAYNHDEEYSANVAAAGERYRRAIEIPTDAFGTTFELGIADPERESISAQIVEDLKALESLAALDW